MPASKLPGRKRHPLRVSALPHAQGQRSPRHRSAAVPAAPVAEPAAGVWDAPAPVGPTEPQKRGSLGREAARGQRPPPPRPPAGGVPPASAHPRLSPTAEDDPGWTFLPLVPLVKEGGAYHNREGLGAPGPTWAFCRGAIRQHSTALQLRQISRKSSR